VKRGVISPTTPLLLGPDIGDGSFKAASIKSIHYKRLPVGQVVAGQTAALALKKIKRTQVGEGWGKWFMVLTSLAKSTAIVCSHCWTVSVCLRAVVVVGAVSRVLGDGADFDLDTCSALIYLIGSTMGLWLGMLINKSRSCTRLSKSWQNCWDCFLTKSRWVSAMSGFVDEHPVKIW